MMMFFNLLQTDLPLKINIISIQYITMFIDEDFLNTLDLL